MEFEESNVDIKMSYTTVIEYIRERPRENENIINYVKER
jgi:hypothetical protein